jgi:DNA-binding HxlR family transcriptional regulator
VGKAASNRQPVVSSRQSAVGNRQSAVGSRQSAGSSRQSAGSRQAEEQRTPIANFDRIIHERLRLGIISALAVNDRLTFNDLKRLLGTTDGNLSVHARKLEDAQYIVVEKSFAGRLPRTEYRVTAAGRRALEKYLAHMEALIKAVRD